MRTSLFAAAVMSLAFCTAVNAAVIGFSNTSSGTQGGSNSGESPLFSSVESLGGAGTFTMDPGYSENYFDFTFAGSGRFAVTGDKVSGYSFMRSFAAGETIGASTVAEYPAFGNRWITILANGERRGVWDTSHSGYIGFQSDTGHYGYLAYDLLRSGRLSTISFNNGAYESEAGQSITIPADAAAIPLPATGLLLVGALGGAGLIRHFRKS